MVGYEHAADAPRSLTHYGEVLALRMNRDTAAHHAFNEAQLIPQPDAAQRVARGLEEQLENEQRQAARALRDATLAAEFETASGMSAPPPPAASAPAESLPVPSAAAVKRGDFELAPDDPGC